MNENVENIEKQEPLQPEINHKRLRRAFILLLVGYICHLLVTLTLGINFKFLPRWLEAFEAFKYIAFILVFIGLSLIYKYKKTFLYALISTGAAFLCSVNAEICSTSSESLFISWGEGLIWSRDVLVCVTLIYFLHGCSLLFEDFGIASHSKKAKAAGISFLVVLGIYFIFRVGKNIRAIMNNLVANRVFLYGTWIFEFIVYIYALVIVINLLIPVIKMRKGGKENEKQ